MNAMKQTTQSSQTKVSSIKRWINIAVVVATGFCLLGCHTGMEESQETPSSSAAPASPAPPSSTRPKLGTSTQKFNMPCLHCGPDKVCRNNMCVCPSNKTLCGNICVNLSNNRSHCGACGNSCSINETCTDGVPTACPGNQRACNNQCVSIYNNPNNCGQCGRVCGRKEWCSYTTCKEHDNWMELCIKTTDGKNAGTTGELQLSFSNPASNKEWTCRIQGIGKNQKKCCLDLEPTATSDDYNFMYVRNFSNDGAKIYKMWKKRQGGDWVERLCHGSACRIDGNGSCREVRVKMTGSGWGATCSMD